MAVGFQTFDDSGKTLIDSSLIALGLVKSGVLTTGSNPVRSTITIPATNPIIFLAGTRCRIWKTTRPSAGQWSFDVEAMNYYIFDNMRSVGGSAVRPRMEVYTEAGAVSYTSEMFPLSPVYSAPLPTASTYPPTYGVKPLPLSVSVAGGPFAANINMSRNGFTKLGALLDPVPAHDHMREKFSTSASGFSMVFEPIDGEYGGPYSNYGAWPFNSRQPIITLIKSDILPSSYSLVG